MQVHDIKSPPGAGSARKRKGRGISPGQGKTAGRGHKGQKARSGWSIRRGNEGGQMPLFQRLPKRGFTNIFKVKWNIVNMSDLNRFADGTVVNPELLLEARLIRNTKDKVKILGKGTLEKKLTVQAHGFSKTAADKIAETGGQVEVL